MLKTLMIGAGRAARSYCAGLRQAGFDLIGVVDIDPSRAQALAEEQGCPAGLGLAQEAEVAMICTPPASHAEWTLRALRRGLHVLCEKPLCLNLQEAREVLAAAHQSGRQLVLSSKYRHLPQMREGLARLQPPFHLEGSFCAVQDMRSTWHCHQPVSGGGVFVDAGSHALDILVEWLGPFDSLEVKEDGERAQGLRVEESVTVLAQSGRGQGRFELSWNRKGPDTFLHVLASNGEMELRWQDYARDQAFLGVLQHFRHSILHPMPLEEARMLHLTEAIERGVTVLERA